MKQQGDQISDATLRKLGSEGIDSIQLNEYSKDKKLVLIGVPGAFTPTCSVNHVPGFIEKADEILAKGVDEIICISVTNPWVMDAWGKNLNADKITMLSDGNCEFTLKVWDSLWTAAALDLVKFHRDMLLSSKTGR